jgi:delta-aminolevulinic acid dehydratase/porphobilinogen synthase
VRVRALKDAVPSLGVITDVALDPSRPTARTGSIDAIAATS